MSRRRPGDRVGVSFFFMRLAPIGVVVLVLSIWTGCEQQRGEKAAASSVLAPERDPSLKVEKFAFDSTSSAIDFVGYKVSANRPGRFMGFRGTIEAVREKPEQSRAVVEIDMGSVQAEDEKVTAHLKSADFFDAVRFPKAIFTTTDVRPRGEGVGKYTISGELELHGMKRQISFPAVINIENDVLKAKAQFSLHRKDFSVAYPGMPDDVIMDEVLVKLQIRGEKERPVQPPGGAPSAAETAPAQTKSTAPESVAPAQDGGPPPAAPAVPMGTQSGPGTATQ